MSSHLFPLLWPFSWGKGHVSVSDPGVDLLDRSSLCFCDSQHLDEREKERGVWANDNKSAEGGTEGDVTFNSIDLPPCHPYPTPPLSPPSHTQAHRHLRRPQSWWHQSSSGSLTTTPGQRAEGRGWWGSRAYVKNAVVVFLPVEECGLITIKPTTQSWVTWQHLWPVE